MKKRAIVRELAAVRQQLAALSLSVSDLRTALDAITASQGEIDLPAFHTAVGWLHERIDTVATKQEAMGVKLGNMRGDPALDGAAVKRLAFAVAQFAARLDRLEAPPPPKARPKPKSPRTAK